MSLKVLALPRDSNPYQRLLYGALESDGHRVRYAADLTPSHALNLLALPAELIVCRLLGWRILHIHWVFGFGLAGGGRIPGTRHLARAWFGLVLRTARLLGVRVVWTAHNVLPHQQVFPDDAAARRRLVAAADVVLAHDHATPVALGSIGARPRRTAIVPHGPLHPALAQATPRESAQGPRTVLLFGRILPYKGAEDLIAAVGRARSAGSEIRAVIAGSCPDATLRRRLRTLAATVGDGIELRLEHVPDDDLAGLLAGCDAVVLPFRRITTSASVAHALGAARPVIVPDMPAFADLPVQRYDGSAAGLVAALCWIQDAPGAELEQLGERGAAHAEGLSWERAAAQTAAELEALPGPGPLGAALDRVAAEPIYRGSLLLLVNTVVLALFGFVFWALAARMYPARSVGVFSGVTSTITLLGAVAALGLPNTLMRHLSASADPRRLVEGVLGAVVVAGGLLCLAVVLVAGPHLPASLHLHTGVGAAAGLAALVAVATASAATDAALIAVRSTQALLAKNLAGGILKVAVLPALATLATSGLIAAYAVGSALSAALGLAALRRRLPDAAAPASRVALLRRHASFSAGTYAGTLVGILPLTTVPLLVLAIRGASETAWFTSAFVIAGFLNFIPSTVAQVVFAEVSRDASALRRDVVKAVRGIYLLLLPVLALTIVGAPWILRLFGAQYSAHAAPALRVLALGALFTGGTYLVDAILAARDRVFGYMVMNAVNAVLVLGATGALLPYGLTAAAWGWAGAQALSLVVGLGMLRRLGVWREQRPAVPRERLAAAA